jgi:hypothetical protein
MLPGLTLKGKRRAAAIWAAGILAVLVSACSQDSSAPNRVAEPTSEQAIVDAIVTKIGTLPGIEPPERRANCPSGGVGCWYMNGLPESVALGLQDLFHDAGYPNAPLNCLDPVRYCRVEIDKGFSGTAVTVRILRRHTDVTQSVAKWRHLRRGSMIWAVARY